MQLNRPKCEALVFGGMNTVRFADDTQVKVTSEAKYLGCMLNTHNDTVREVRLRIKETAIVLQRMHVFWKKSTCTVRFKLQVLSQVLLSKILYGLESAELTQATLNKLDIFHLKCLRKLLNFKTTYITRSNTNEYVYNTANRMLFREQDRLRKRRHHKNQSYRSVNNTLNASSNSS